MSTSFLPTLNSQGSPAYYGSSADAYAQLNPASSSSTTTQPNYPNLSRPETAMSFEQLGPDGSQHTHATGDSNAQRNKRGSVLSFQTALSGPSNARSTDGFCPQPGARTASQADSHTRSDGDVEYMKNNRSYLAAYSHPSNAHDVSLPGAWLEVAAGASEPRRRTHSPQISKAEIVGLPLRPGSPAGRNCRASKGRPWNLQSDGTYAIPDSNPYASIEPTDSMPLESLGQEACEAVSAGPPAQPMGEELDDSSLLDRHRTLKAIHGREGSTQSINNYLIHSSGHSREPSGSNLIPNSLTFADDSPDGHNSIPPQIPDKNELCGPPPLPAKERVPSPLMTNTNGPAFSRGFPTSQYASDIIPPPLPGSVLPNAPVVAPMNIEAPVSDFRKKPLVDVTPELQAAGRASLQEQQKGIAGLGAHDGAAAAESLFVREGQEESNGASAGQLRARCNSNAGLLGPRAALVEAPPAPDPVGPASISSADTPSREPSPPPEGEVEARAEWERSKMKQKQKEKKDRQMDTVASGHKNTLRGRLKPLQLVPQENSPVGRGIEPDIGSPGITTSPSPSLTRPNGNGSMRSTGGPTGGGGAAMSTQQLQRQQARDQRRSVGAINLAMVGGADLASGSNGPYPVFASPSTAATPGAVVGAGRLYPGMLPQRSLIPPFELQQRPDGLLSGLIGPDGIRRSINDPEVCLECMMRDEDMIDVHVVGPGLWERESDRDFEEAIRQEQEQDARRANDRERNVAAGSTTGEDQGGSVTGHNASQHSTLGREGHTGKGSKTKVRVKRVGQYDELTAERLKIHTQMNPPASSHRWRTLQTFLAEQAKYIAFEQRARKEEWERTNSVEARAAAIASRDRMLSSALSKNGSGDTPLAHDKDASVTRKSVSKNRSASALFSGRSGAQLVADDDLKHEERAMKEREVTALREVRRKNAASTLDIGGNGAAMGVLPKTAGILHASRQIPAPPAPHSPLLIQTETADEQQRKFSSSPITSANAGTHPSPRRPGPGAVPSRGVSASDLRSMQVANLSSPAMPSTPDSLAPPSAMMYASTPKGFGGRTASQLSLAPSGSMLDMHLALAGTSAESRAGLALPLPMPSPTDLERSGPASTRNLFGFSGDGDVISTDVTMPPPSYQHQDEPLAGLADLSVDQNENLTGNMSAGANKKKGKGLRGFFSKRSGGGNKGDGVNGSSRQSDSSGSPRVRRGSLSADSPLTTPPGIGGLIARARRSTSSLAGGRDSVDQVRDVYGVEPPGMMSPDRFDMGPFQPPLPPERKQSKLVPEDSRSPNMPMAPSFALRSTSSNSFLESQRVPSTQSVNQMSQSSNANAAGLHGESSSRQLVGSGLASMSTTTSGRISPASSRTVSMASLQSRSGPGRGHPTNTLSTINASPGVGTQSLEGDPKAKGPLAAVAQIGADAASVRSNRSTATNNTSSRRRSESGNSVADSKSSRFSFMSKLPFDSFTVRQSSHMQQVGKGQQPQRQQRQMPSVDAMAPGHPSLNMPPLRPARSPRRQDVSGSSHTTTVPLRRQHLQDPSKPSSVGHNPQTSVVPMSAPCSVGDFNGMTQQSGDYPAYFPSLQQQQTSLPPSSGKDRKSKLLKLPFSLTKNKNRSSSILSPFTGTFESAKLEGQSQHECEPSGIANEELNYHRRPSFQLSSGFRSLSSTLDTRSLRSRASTTFMPSVPGRQTPPEQGDADGDQEQILPPLTARPRKSMHFFQRPRATSSAAFSDVPSRSESALEKLPLAGFVKSKRRQQQS